MPGNVPIEPLTFAPSGHVPSLGDGDAYDSAVVSEIPVQVIEYYPYRGAVAAGRSHWSVQRFSDPGQVNFFTLHVRYPFVPIFSS